MSHYLINDSLASNYGEYNAKLPISWIYVWTMAVIFHLNFAVEILVDQEKTFLHIVSTI